jgi:hypothetical protein
VRPHGRFQYAVDARRLIKVSGGGSRGHEPSCLRGGNSYFRFDAVVDRRASLVVRRRYNLILNLAGVATMADRSTHRHSHISRNHNFCLRTECYLLVIFQGECALRGSLFALTITTRHKDPDDCPKN